ncbi:MAG: OmpA family protein [Bacillota bacterium]
MARKKAPEEGKKGAPEWLATYGDMMTLLLCFFVLLFAMSSIDAQKFEALVQSLSGAIGVLDSGSTVQLQPMINSYPNDSPIEDEDEYKQAAEEEELDELKQQIEEFLEENQLQDSIVLEINERGLLVRFLDKVLFDSGKADLRPEALEIMNMVAELLNENSRNIRIEGHTDNRPINTARFPSNWELSTQRACNVLKYLIQKNVLPERLAPTGYADTKPIDTNDTPEGRQNNRRVDIIILRASQDALEPR